MECPKCGGRLVKAGFSISQKNGRQQRYKCQAKGHIITFPLTREEEKPTPRGSRRRYF